MRLFFCVEIKGPAFGRMLEAVQDLASCRASVKWVSADLHMTLAFLGETPDSRLTAVKEAGARTALAAKPAQGCLNGLGAFPSWDRPRIVWAGVGAGPACDSLVESARLLRGHLKSGGFETEDREFTPHATLGRVKGPKGLDRLIEGARKWRAPEPWKGASFDVRELTLMESRLGPEGPQYVPVERYPFQGGAA